MLFAPLRTLAIALLTLGLAACASGGGALSPGLSARMDKPGAALDRAEAIGIVNHYRQSSGAPALTEDPTLDATAQALAATYMKTGKQPSKPAGAVSPVAQSSGVRTSFVISTPANFRSRILSPGRPANSSFSFIRRSQTT